MDKYEIPFFDSQFQKIIQECESLPENEQIPYLNERMEEVRKEAWFPTEVRTNLIEKYLKEIEIKQRMFASREISNNNQKSKSSDSDKKSRVQKIQWIAKDMYLIAIFELLRRSNYLHSDVKDNIPSMICKHFSDKNNDAFVNNNIRSQKNRLLQDDIKVEEVSNEIITSFRKASEALIDEARA